MTDLFVIVVVVFLGSTPTQWRVFALDPEEFKVSADCEKERKRFLAEHAKQAAENNVILWAECHAVKRPVVGVPGTKSNS